MVISQPLLLFKNRSIPIICDASLSSYGTSLEFVYVYADEEKKNKGVTEEFALAPSVTKYSRLDTSNSSFSALWGRLSTT